LNDEAIEKYAKKQVENRSQWVTWLNQLLVQSSFLIDFFKAKNLNKNKKNLASSWTWLSIINDSSVAHSNISVLHF